MSGDEVVGLQLPPSVETLSRSSVIQYARIRSSLSTIVHGSGLSRGGIVERLL